MLNGVLLTRSQLGPGKGAWELPALGSLSSGKAMSCWVQAKAERRQLMRTPFLP